MRVTERDRVWLKNREIQRETEKYIDRQRKYETEIRDREIYRQTEKPWDRDKRQRDI